MERLIIDIEDRLRERVPELATVDENYGQLAKMFDEGDDSDIYPLVGPAALVDVQTVSWGNLAGAAQQGAATVVVTLAIDCYDDTHLEQEQRHRIADRMALAARVHWALQGWKPSETTKLVRTQTRLYHLPRLWKAYETTYTCAVVDAGGGMGSGVPLSIYD